MLDVVIVGAGPVGANAAVFLATSGVSVELVEAGTDILSGASQAAFIHHGDGFEYYKPGHHRTGEYCIDGSLVKGLLYPLAALRTRVCDAEHPIRFLLTRESVLKDGVELPAFLENARSMQQHFTRRFEAVRRKLDCPPEHLESMFLRGPASFWRPLAPPDFEDVDGVVGGCSGSSSGINMAHYYAILKQGLRSRGVGFHSRCPAETIEKVPGGFAVHAGGRTLFARQVLLAAGHQMPALVSKIRGVEVAPPPAGTYFLNVMTFLELPPTRDRKRLAAAARINFALQQDHGGMFACVAAPTEDVAGLAVAYAPCSNGSQLSAHPFGAGSPPPPRSWESLVRDGLPADHPNVVGAWQQISTLYGFVRDYAKVVRSICRTVFNINTADSNGGNDRRVREIVQAEPRISADGMISAWAAPKWTNAELVALMATDYALKRLGAPPLPKHPEFGFGPTALDVAEIAPAFRLESMRENEARAFARAEGLPESLVDANLVAPAG